MIPGKLTIQAFESVTLTDSVQAGMFKGSCMVDE